MNANSTDELRTLMSMRVKRKGIFSGNFSRLVATSKQSPKSMCRT
jgi:hypothetical protein